MSRLELIKLFLYFFLTFLLTSTIGIQTISILDKFLIKSNSKIFKTYKNELLFFSVPVGLSVVAYVNLFLGLFGYFNEVVIYITTIVLFLFSLSKVYFIKIALISLIHTFYKVVLEYKVLLIPAVLIVIISCSLFLASLQPPISTDELAYHFPQVKDIVENKRIDPHFLGHYFYGNIPKLMEIIFALGYALSGYSLAHLLNTMLMFSFLGLVFVILSKTYGTKTAIISLLLLLLYDDFTWNATTGYIDSATTGLEIASLLLGIYWVVKKDLLLLLLSSLSIGMSLGMKYSAIPTIFFLIITIIVENKKTIVENIKIFFIPAFIFGSFWYLKNIFYFKNPVYPLYFGHEGVSEVAYSGLINAINQFGPKTIDNFFALINTFRNIDSITVYLSLYAAIFSIFVKDSILITRRLLLYYIMYLPYWFLFATHQVRFLMPDIIVATILTSIILSKLINKREFYILIVSILSILTLGSHETKNIWVTYWNNKFNLIERQYGLGNISEKEFLYRNLGCQFQIIDYLYTNNLSGNVVDNWSAWFEPSTSFYTSRNKFVSYDFDITKTRAELISFLSTNNIKYIYVNINLKEKHLTSTDVEVSQRASSKIPLENYLLKNSTIIKNIGECYLYRLDLH